MHIKHILVDPRTNGMIEFIANRMMIILSSPEDYLVKEGDTLAGKTTSLSNLIIDNDSMYFIASGVCVVTQRDIASHKSKSKEIVDLHPGDYFGVSCF